MSNERRTEGEETTGAEAPTPKLPKLPKPERENLPRPEPADVTAYFAEKKAGNDACPVCGTNAWSIFAPDPGFVGTTVGALKQDGNFHGNHVRLLTLICENCKFVRQHLYNDFQWWLENKKKETTGG